MIRSFFNSTIFSFMIFELDFMFRFYLKFLLCLTDAFFTITF